MILSPEQPPTYLLDGPHGRLGVSRCAFVPERILRHRIRKGQDQYLVKWERYPDTEATWEPADRLEEDVPALIRKFWE
ncbi:chromo domain-containing protein LHP1-like [Rhizophagus irregularis DAOM 181602=DAOM 197198]|nr:chromo domain-containing protein LHP1-like [Rhizophagus irregularis DAOM 181602=DAOM 197198]GBC15350.2 chromo domain-containing protein LHP1-like [Rhizophagus irregularis DAOM 181602=DAOM 197198]